MRDFIFQIHTVAGILIFATGLLQFLRKKGGRLHRKLGKIYVVGWLIVLLTGAYLGGMLITLIGIFGFYFAVTGIRVVQLNGKSVQIFDWTFAILNLLVMAAILFYAARLFMVGNSSFGTIFLVFGLLFILTLQKDIRKYFNIGPAVAVKVPKMDWYLEHFRRMSISYIAALTAFASIQNVFGHNTLNFLLPTAIGTSMIIIISRRMERKFGTVRKQYKSD